MSQQIHPERVQQAVDWAAKWIAMKCCSAIHTKIMDSKPSLCSLLSQCQAALKNKAVYAPEELMFGLLLFQNPSYQEDEIEECTKTISNNFSTHYRQMYAMVVKRIGEWWNDKIQQLPKHRVLITRTEIDLEDFVLSFTKYIGDSFEDLFSLFDNILFMQDIINACVTMTHYSSVTSIEPNQGKIISGSNFSRKPTDTGCEGTSQIDSKRPKLYLTSMSKPREPSGPGDADQDGTVGLSRTQEKQGFVEESKSYDTDSSDDGLENDNDLFTSDLDAVPVWDSNGSDVHWMVDLREKDYWEEDGDV